MIDWSGKLEAINSKGCVVAAEYDQKLDTRGHMIKFDRGDGLWSWGIDHAGISFSTDWRIRNVPEPTQALSPELVARMAKHLRKVVRMYPTRPLRDATAQEMWDEASALVAELPQPIDPDKGWAEKLLSERGWFVSGEEHAHALWLMFEAIKYGRETASEA